MLGFLAEGHLLSLKAREASAERDGERILSKAGGMGGDCKVGGTLGEQKPTSLQQLGHFSLKLLQGLSR